MSIIKPFYLSSKNWQPKLLNGAIERSPITAASSHVFKGLPTSIIKTMSQLKASEGLPEGCFVAVKQGELTMLNVITDRLGNLFDYWMFLLRHPEMNTSVDFPLLHIFEGIQEDSHLGNREMVFPSEHYLNELPSYGMTELFFEGGCLSNLGVVDGLTCQFLRFQGSGEAGSEGVNLHRSTFEYGTDGMKLHDWLISGKPEGRNTEILFLHSGLGVNEANAWETINSQVLTALYHLPTTKSSKPILPKSNEQDFNPVTFNTTLAAKMNEFAQGIRAGLETLRLEDEVPEAEQEETQPETLQEPKQTEPEAIQASTDKVIPRTENSLLSRENLPEMLSIFVESNIELSQFNSQLIEILQKIEPVKKQQLLKRTLGINLPQEEREAFAAFLREVGLEKIINNKSKLPPELFVSSEEVWKVNPEWSFDREIKETLLKKALLACHLAEGLEVDFVQEQLQVFMKAQANAEVPTKQTFQILPPISLQSGFTKLQEVQMLMEVGIRGKLVSEDQISRTLKPLAAQESMILQAELARRAFTADEGYGLPTLFCFYSFPADSIVADNKGKVIGFAVPERITNKEFKDAIRLADQTLKAYNLEGRITYSLLDDFKNHCIALNTLIATHSFICKMASTAVNKGTEIRANLFSYLQNIFLTTLRFGLPESEIYSTSAESEISRQVYGFMTSEEGFTFDEILNQLKREDGKYDSVKVLEFLDLIKLLNERVASSLEMKYFQLHLDSIQLKDLRKLLDSEFLSGRPLISSKALLDEQTRLRKQNINSTKFIGFSDIERRSIFDQQVQSGTKSDRPVDVVLPYQVFSDVYTYQTPCVNDFMFDEDGNVVGLQLSQGNVVNADFYRRSQMYKMLLETAIKRTKRENQKWDLKYLKEEDLQAYIDLMKDMAENTKDNILWCGKNTKSLPSMSGLNQRLLNLKGITREYLLAAYLTAKRFNVSESVLKGEGDSPAKSLLIDLLLDRQNFDEVFPTLTVEGQCSLEKLMDELKATFELLKEYLITEKNRTL